MINVTTGVFQDLVPEEVKGLTSKIEVNLDLEITPERLAKIKHMFSYKIPIIVEFESETVKVKVRVLATPDTLIQDGELSATEALNSFVGWLCCREEVISIGSSEDCAVWAELINKFSEVNNLEPPRPSWPSNVKVVLQDTKE